MSAEVKILKEEARGALSLNLSVISYDEGNSPYVLIREEDGGMVRLVCPQSLYQPVS